MLFNAIRCNDMQAMQCYAITMQCLVMRQCFAKCSRVVFDLAKSKRRNFFSRYDKKLSTTNISVCLSLLLFQQKTDPGWDICCGQFFGILKKQFRGFDLANLITTLVIDYNFLKTNKFVVIHDQIVALATTFWISDIGINIEIQETTKTK